MECQYLELSKVAELRSKMYGLLSSIYLQPIDRYFLRLIKELVGSHLEKGLNEQIPEKVYKGLEGVNEYLRLNSGVPSGVHEERLASEFTRLFRGINKSYSPLPPYESVYEEGLCFGESTVEVSKDYRSFNLNLGDKFKGEPSDHISFELDFMRLLCEKEGKAWNNNDREEVSMLLKAEERFLNKHLLKWISKFCENIRKYDKLGFYQSWADVTEGWINFDHQEIDNYKTML